MLLQRAPARSRPQTPTHSPGLIPTTPCWPPDDVDNLIADLDQPATIVLTTRDKFGNRCEEGGLRVAGRLNLIKQSMNDITVLSASNNTVAVEDYNDGTYGVKVALLMAATVRLTVNMDKDMQGTSGELPPIQLTFVKPSETAGAVAGSPPSSPQAAQIEAPETASETK